MRVSRLVVVASGAALLALGAVALGLDVPTGPASFTAAQKAAVEKEVRQFAASVSRDVTQQGPAAWEKHFADSPAFFMASDGKLVFPNRQAASQAIGELTRTIQHIELTWGDDLRVDAFTISPFWQVPGMRSRSTGKVIRRPKTASSPAWRSVATANGSFATRIGRWLCQPRRRESQT